MVIESNLEYEKNSFRSKQRVQITMFSEDP